MSLYVPGRGWEPDPRGIDRNDPEAMADYDRRYNDYWNKPIKESPRDEGPRTELITRPTRNLGDILRKPEGGDTDAWRRTQRDAELPRSKKDFIREREEYDGPNPWGPGREPMDWGRTSPNRPERRPEPERRRRDGWEEPRRPAPGRGGEIGRGLDTDTDRLSLLTGGKGLGGGGGRSPSSFEERMKLLTGSTDPVSKPWQSQYGGREEYDPQDREFNRQFDERPRGPQPWNSDYGLANYDVQEGKNKGNRYWEGGRLWETQPAESWDYGGDLKGSIPEGRTDVTPPSTGPGGPKASPAYDDSDLQRRIAALEARGPIVNQPTQDLSDIQKRLQDLEGRPQSTGGGWQEDRIAALEGRKPQDLSGITGRISELEGRKPSWQEDRIKSLEGRQDDTSWKDPLAQVQAGQQAGKEARSALDTRLGALENYYKNDPPPEDSVGDRYEDKLANLNKMWEQPGSTWDKVKDTIRYPDSDDDRKWSVWGQHNWVQELPNPYVQGIRDLKKEYNKPQHTAIIKGREYKAYGPRAAQRLRSLDEWNIHEDQYLGSGTWKDQYGEDVTGWGKGHKDRYFASQSGLDRDSEEYKKRFRSPWVSEADEQGNWGSGKDYAYYN